MDAQEKNIEELLSDQSFLDYCIGNNEDAVLTWTAWQKQSPQRKKTVAEAKKIYFALNGNITSEDFMKDFQVFQDRFAAHLQGGRNPGHGRGRALWIGLSAAAACLLVGFYFFSVTSKKDATRQLVYTSAPGKRQKITLVDGTQVVLNSGTKLTLSEDYNQTSRNVTLDGEAYFVVKHDDKKIFKVSAGSLEIRDLGTIFNIKAYGSDNISETSLIEGKIEIISRSGKTKIIQLTPNQKLIHENSDDAVKNPTIKSLTQLNPGEEGHGSSAETDWVDNRLTFNDESLKETALKLERWYGVKVNILGTADQNSTFTATFDHETVTSVLEALKLSGNFNYRKEGNIITIY